MPEFEFLRDIIFLFGIGIFSVLFSHKLKLSPIVGFLISGIIVGPYGFDLLSDSLKIETLAELGVMLLLFSIGIELSLKKLLELGRFFLTAGLGQIVFTVVIVSVVAHFFSLSWPQSIFLGMLVSLSSTALVLRFMTDRGELNSLHGKTSVSLLIFQDLMIVPMILLTPFLSSDEGQTANVFLTILKAFLLVIFAIFAARVVVPWLLHQVVKTRNREAFILTLVFLCIGTAWMSAQAGLSLTLGAFIAGLVISESDYSLHAISEILPLREVFNSIFFISVGMLFNPMLIVESPSYLLGGIVSIVFIKFIVTGFVTYAHGYSLRVSFLTGLILAQVGEFSFVLSKEGLAHGVMDHDMYSAFIAVAVGTMLATPFIRGLWPPIARYMDKHLDVKWSQGRQVEFAQEKGLATLKDHTIIVGYGPNGKHLARVLKQINIQYVVIEMNPETVKKQREKGLSILYGDAGREEVLHRAVIDHARLIVIAIPDYAATRRVISMAKQLNPHIHIIVRTNYYRELPDLAQLGAHEIVSQEFESSIEIFTRALKRYLVPRETIEECVSTIRQDRYDMLRSLSAQDHSLDEINRINENLMMEVIQIPEKSPLVGQSLSQSELKIRTGVNLVALQSIDGSLLTNPSSDVVFRTHDVVMVVGVPSQVEKAKEMFLKEFNHRR